MSDAVCVRQPGKDEQTRLAGRACQRAYAHIAAQLVVVVEPSRILGAHQQRLPERDMPRCEGDDLFTRRVLRAAVEYGDAATRDVILRR